MKPGHRTLGVALAGASAFFALTACPKPAHAAIEEIFLLVGDQLWVAERVVGGFPNEVAWTRLGTVSNLGPLRPPVGGISLSGAALTTAGIVGTAVVATILIDCAMYDECIWTTVDNAGGWFQVLGIGPNPAAAPNPNAVTVSCADPRPRGDQCRQALGNSITGYYTWAWGSYWTCGDIWADGSTSGSADWVAALDSCNQSAAACENATADVCAHAAME